MKTLPFAMTLLALAAPVAARQAAPQPGEPVIPAVNPASNTSAGTPSVRLTGAGGDPAGTATLTAMPLGVLVEVDAMGPPPDAWVAPRVRASTSAGPATRPVATRAPGGISTRRASAAASRWRAGPMRATCQTSIPTRRGPRRRRSSTR